MLLLYHAHTEPRRAMTPEQQQELNQHIQAIAKILHQEAEAEKIQTLEGIETTIREQT